VKLLFRCAAGFCITRTFLLIFTKTEKKYQPKSAKKNFFVPSKCQNTKEILFITVLSFFYGLKFFENFYSAAKLLIGGQNLNFKEVISKIFGM
jgi:hypothetical protein